VRLHGFENEIQRAIDGEGLRERYVGRPEVSIPRLAKTFEQASTEHVLVRVLWILANRQSSVLPFDFGLQPAYRVPVFWIERDGVCLRIRLSSLDGVGGCDVYDGSTEFNGAHDGSVLERLAGRREGLAYNAQEEKEGEGSPATLWHGEDATSVGFPIWAGK
jgi:hypothetical protein